MNQTNAILPVYTSDVSGVCSALYELGGLVVMHDPSGCNSTYNTHDEIRWYEKDSLIFISGLTQCDAIMGNDEKFFKDVLETAREFNLEFIAITNSPIPYLTGTDFNALVKRLEKESGIPAFYVPANGMHDYTMGAGKAFAKVAERLVDSKYSSAVKQSVNIIGMTPLDYAAKGSSAAIKNILEDAGYKVISVWAMDDPAENIRRAGEASVNLVVSSTGLFAAKKLKERFGTPFVMGTPVGNFAPELITALDMVQKTKKNICAYANENHFEDDICFKSSGTESCNNPPAPAIIGEPVISGSLAAAIEIKHKIKTKVICPTEIYEGLLRKEDVHVHGEEEIIRQLEGIKKLVADPMYKWICPEETRLYPLPSVSMSGRIYLKEIKRLTDLAI